MRYVLIDRFLELEKGRRGRAVKCVTRGEPFMAHRSAYPAALVLESLLQMGGAVTRSAIAFRRRSVLGKVERAAFPARAHPGDAIELDVEVIQSRPEGNVFKGVARVGGSVIARARFLILFMPPEQELAFDEERAKKDFERRRALCVPRELEAK